MSTRSKRPEENLWYVHAPTKKETRPLVEAPPPSNIPYLNGVMDTEEEMNKKQEIFFRETDSEFVKLSKLGGREDLLIHKHKERPKGPVGYPIASWWTDMMQLNEQEPTKPEKYIFEVPAWFAHQNKVKREELIDSAPVNYPYAVDKNKNYLNGNNKHEAIEEPKKYGELRNFMNPIRIKPTNTKNTKSNQSYTPSSNQLTRIPSSTTMPKLIGNFYERERPNNYQEWKSQNDVSSQRQSIGVSSSSKLRK